MKHSIRMFYLGARCRLENNFYFIHAISTPMFDFDFPYPEVWLHRSTGNGKTELRKLARHEIDQLIFENEN